MSEPCLHCEIWRAVRDHTRFRGATLNGLAICDRRSVINLAGTVLAEALYTEPDLERRRAITEEICIQLREVAATPGSAQPLKDLEVVSWQ